MEIRKPIFFIGVPRSGTTVIFEVFSTHEDLGWFSNLFSRAPQFPILSVLSRLSSFDCFRGHKDQEYQKQRARKYQIYPQETYTVWERYGRKDFPSGYLLGVGASASEKRSLHNLVAKVLLYHGKKRFANKLTGPSRIYYLNSVFEDALFVHIIRDGRAVVNSLMKVPFWQGKNGFVKPFWDNGLPGKYVQEWQCYNSTPLALAAVQWKNIIEIAREESLTLQGNRYCEIKYEEFLQNPYETIEHINNFCGLSSSRSQQEYLENRVTLEQANAKYLSAFTSNDLSILNEIMRDMLLNLGYLT